MVFLFCQATSEFCYQNLALLEYPVNLYNCMIMCMCSMNFLNGLCNSRKYPYLPPQKGFCSKTPPPTTPLEIPIKLHTFLIEPPTPQEIPIPSVGGVWIFSGTAHFALIRHHNKVTNIFVQYFIAPTPYKYVKPKPNLRLYKNEAWHSQRHLQVGKT